MGSAGIYNVCYDFLKTFYEIFINVMIHYDTKDSEQKNLNAQ